MFLFPAPKSFFPFCIPIPFSTVRCKKECFSAPESSQPATRCQMRQFFAPKSVVSPDWCKKKCFSAPESSQPATRCQMRQFFAPESVTSTVRCKKECFSAPESSQPATRCKMRQFFAPDSLWAATSGYIPYFFSFE